MSNCSNCPSKGSCNNKEHCSIENNPQNNIGKIIGIMSGKGGVGKSTITALTANQLAKQGYNNKEHCSIENNPQNNIGKIIGIMSGKGGVGKSTITALTANQLAKQGYSVGILDADITGPSIPRLMGVKDMSGKGGVGKSTITALTANQLAKQGYSVGILDADITGPSIPRLMGVKDAKALSDGESIFPVVNGNGIKVMSINLMMDDENEPVIWRGPILGGVVKQFYTDVIWGDLDYLLIDMPPGTGDVALTVMQNIPINGTVMVSVPQDLVSMIVSKAVNMAKKMDIPVYGVVDRYASRNR